MANIFTLFDIEQLWAILSVCYSHQGLSQAGTYCRQMWNQEITVNWVANALLSNQVCEFVNQKNKESQVSMHFSAFEI